MKPDAETIRDVILRFVEKCATREDKSVLVLWSKDREENFVPQEGGLRLHQDSVEFIDTDGTPTVLPFSSIARIEIDENDTHVESPLPSSEIDGSTCNVVKFPKNRES